MNPENIVMLSQAEYTMLSNRQKDALRLSNENAVLRSSLASSEANVADLQADIDNLNAKVKVLKELIKEIANG